MSAAVEAPPLTLRQRAIAAARASRAEQERRTAENQELAQRACCENLQRVLNRHLGVQGVVARFNAQANAAEAVVDGLLFRIQVDAHFPYEPRVMVPCKRCSQLLPFGYGNLVGLGQVLEGTVGPEHRWGCPAEPPAPTPDPEPEPTRQLTTAERLVAVLEELIAERVSGGQP